MDSRFASLISATDLRKEAIHGPFIPADIRQGERYAGWYRREGHSRWHPITLWRLSPYGAEVLVGAEALPRDKLELRLRVGEQEITQKGRAVLDPWQEHGRTLAGIHFERYVPLWQAEGPKEKETRSEVRFAAHPYFFPTGLSKTASRFADNIHFRVINLSASGLLLVTSLRNKTMMPGLVLDSTLTFPGGKSAKCRFEVKHCQVKRESIGLMQHVGVRILEPSRRLLNHLGHYAFAFGHSDKVLPTPKVLREAGFILHNTQDGIEYDYVRSEEEYQQVLELRAMALHSVPSLKSTASVDKMRDEYDERSRIIVARFRGKIVGTVRITFHRPEDKFEDERYCVFPADLPPREEIVEASRAATHPDFRGTDVFVNLLRFGVIATLQGGRRYMVQGTFDGLVPVYKRFGFKELGVTFDHPNITGFRVHLLAIDLKKAVAGGLNPLVWNLMVPKLRDFVPDEAQEWSAVLKAPWLALYRTAAPIAHLAERVGAFKREQAVVKARSARERTSKAGRELRGD